MVQNVNSDMVMEDICKESSKYGVVVYGAGYYGKNVSRYLKERYGITIKGYAVSTKDHINYDNDISGKISTIEEVAKENNRCVLIIAVSEQKQNELIELALKCGFTKVYTILNEFLDYIKSELKDDKLKPLDKLNFEVHITDHCNLNCSKCIHFSPLSEESYLSIDEFERDFARMHTLCDERVSQIVLLGGEPLLHPQISDFFYIARNHFKSSNIVLLTNGTLLDRMNEAFWEACIHNSIILKCTKYPINVDYDSLEKIANEHGLSISYQNDITEGEKMMFKFPFDLEGNQPIEWNYKHCTRSNFCITLKRGRLFTCPLAAHAHIAKKYFNLDIELSEKDSIDVYRAQSFEELTNFLVTPIPFCRYCNLKVKAEQEKWCVSQKKFEEWF